MAAPQPASKRHNEPEKPLVYEPPDLHGRKHVEKVAGEYRVREDECLADKLQNEEFELHFGKNKNDRWRGRMDVQTAKSIYLREVEESGLLSQAELKRLTRDDNFIAHEINRRLTEEKDVESQRKAAVEMQDEEFARYLEAKEREKVELERKKRLERRIAQDRQAAERLQQEMENENTAGIEKSNVYESPDGHGSSTRRQQEQREPRQRSGWDIDFEVGATAGTKTKEELDALKDAEIARSMQLKSTEEEQKRLEEERDRKVAMKLQREEADRYKQEKEERRRQRESVRRQQDDHREEVQLEVEPTVTSEQTRKKKLHTVDATGRPTDSVNGSTTHTPQRNGSSERRRADTTEAKQRHGSSERRHHNSNERQRADSTPHRQGSDKQMRNGEPTYLTAVDATGRVVTNGNHAQDPRLVDDQRALQEQMRQVDLIGKQQPRPKDSRSNKKKSQKNSSQNVYDTPENQPPYGNVVTNLDPTYSSIDSLPRQQQQQHNGNHTDHLDEQGNIRPAQIIQNVKRSPEDGSKKKKKWFSKKEKSK